MTRRRPRGAGAPPVPGGQRLGRCGCTEGAQQRSCQVTRQPGPGAGGITMTRPRHRSTGAAPRPSLPITLTTRTSPSHAALLRQHNQLPTQRGPRRRLQQVLPLGMVDIVYKQAWGQGIVTCQGGQHVLCGPRRPATPRAPAGPPSRPGLQTARPAPRTAAPARARAAAAGAARQCPASPRRLLMVDARILGL